MAVQELGLVWVLKKYFALGNEFFDNASFGLQLSERLLLPLNQLFNILNTTWSNVTSRAKHDSIQELNMGFQLVTISITFPVEIDFDLGLENSGNEVLMLADHGLQFIHIVGPLVFTSLSHQDFQDILQPFLNFGTLQIFAEGMEVVSFAFEFS